MNFHLTKKESAQASRPTKLAADIQTEIIFIMFQIKLVKMLDFVWSEKHSIYTQNSFP